jgi:predicted metal-dependent hydrolase
MEVGDITINVIRKNIKNIHLTVRPPSGMVRVSAPMRATDEMIRSFVTSKTGWIHKHRRKLEDRGQIPPLEYKKGECHYLFGIRYLLTVTEGDSGPKVIIRNKTHIDLYIRPNTPDEKRFAIMQEWYRGEIKKVIPEIVSKWEDKTGLKVNEWKVKQMKTRWGSCNIREKRIWINLELAKKPIRFLEFIILHEMIHFRERLHNERFKKYMDTYLPEWRQLKTELNKFPAD